MIFDINFDKWIAINLPTFLRRRRIFAFCRALCAPLYIGEESIYKRFLQKRGDHIYRLTHNGQVCYLKAALNNAFNLKKGFEIEDTNLYDGEWAYAKDASMSQQLLAVNEDRFPNEADDDACREYPIPVLADEARLNLVQNSFIVRVPSNIYSTRLDKVKAIVEQYRIPSKTPIYSRISIQDEQSRISINEDIERWKWPISVIDTRSILYSGSDYLFTGISKNRR